MRIGHVYGLDALLDAREDVSSFLRNSSAFMESDEDLTPGARYRLALRRRAQRQDTAPAIEAMNPEGD